MAHIDSAFFGRLPSGWSVERFGNLLCEPVRNGIYKNKEFHGKGVKVINMGELFAHSFISNQPEKRVELSAGELGRYLVRDGDLLFARRSYVLKGSGKCSLVVSPGEPTTFESSIIRARPHVDQAEPRFYFYVFQSPQGRALMGSIATRTAVSGIRGSDLINLEVPRPPLQVQRTVANTLGAFDDLIENNLRRIEILEEMARLLYREWFVHFRFPGHEEVELVDSELGPIPEGWEVRSTADLIAEGSLEIGDGYRAKNAEFDSRGVPFLRVKNVREGYLDLNDCDLLPSDYIQRVGPKASKAGDCVISMKGTVGRMAFPSERTPQLVYSPQVSFWRSLDPGRLDSSFLRLWMQGPRFREQCMRVKGATDMADYVNLRDQRSMKILLPDDSVHASFIAAVKPQLQLVDNLFSQNEVLQQTRDLLLPRLISGELEVTDLDLPTQPTQKEATA